MLILRFWLPFMAPSMGSIARLTRGNKHTKIIALIDNIIPHEKRLGDKLLANFFVSSVDGFVVMSRSVEEELHQFDSQKPVAFCPHPLFDSYGCSVPRYQAISQLKLDPESKYMLFFGFIRDYKGLDLLLKAMQAGADVATCPLSAIVGLLNHPLTESGLKKFLEDYKKLNG